MKIVITININPMMIYKEKETCILHASCLLIDFQNGSMPTSYPHADFKISIIPRCISQHFCIKLSIYSIACPDYRCSTLSLISCVRP